MKPIKMLCSLITAAVLLFVSPFSVRAMEFDAEEAYESVFVIYSGNSVGSGFAVGTNCIVTNAHVISSTENIYVMSYGGQDYRGEILGMDESRDIAVLEVEGADFTYLPEAELSQMEIGDDVYAIGAPKAMAYTMTKGIISAKERRIGQNTYIQMDAAINEGNSGGPLLDRGGQVLGMNTLKLSDSEGIGLAIPIDVIYGFLNEIGISSEGTGDAGNTAQTAAPKDWESPEIPGSVQPEAKDGPDGIVYIAFGVAGVSLMGNVILIFMLVRKKKQDPSERTDFDIDIWE